MADKPKFEAIDLNIKVNEEGLTIKDLLTTLLNELSKNGLYAAGVILKQKDTRVMQIFGHQAKDKSQTFPLEVMRHVVDRFKPEMMHSVETIGGKQV
jgi:hypothetical protein